MANLNKVFLMGNLTRDPALKYTPSGKAVTTLGLAVNDPKDDKNVLFIDVTAWEKTAENCVEYLKKGSAVLVQGKLKLQNWEKDGEKKSKISVTAFNVQFLSFDKKEEPSMPPVDDTDIPF